MFGAGAGALFGGISGAASSFMKHAPQASGDVLAAEAGQPMDLMPGTNANFDAALKMSGMPQNEQAGIIEGMRKLKPNIGELEQAATEEGLPVFVGQKSANEGVQKRWSILVQGGSPVAEAESQAVNNAFEMAANKTKEAIGADGAAGSLREVGDRIAEGLSDKFEAQYQPIKEGYDMVREYGPSMQISENSRNAIARNIRKLIDEHDIVAGTPAANFINNVADGMEKITDLNKLQSYVSNIRKSAPIEAKFTAGLIRDKFSDLEERLFRDLADKMKTPQARDKILEVADRSKSLRSEYRQFAEEMKTVRGALKGRQIYGPQDFLNYLEETSPEKFAKNLFQKENSRFTEWFSKKFPEQWQEVTKYQKGKLLSDAGGDPFRAIKSIEKLEPELKKQMFTPEQLKTIKNVKTWADAFPKKFNPSESATAYGWMQFLKSPVEAAYQTARDVGIKGSFHYLGLTADDAAKVGGLSWIEKSAQKTSRIIETTARSIVDAGKVTRAIISAEGNKLASSKPATHDDINHVSDIVASLQTNPEAFIDHMEKTISPVQAVAPNIAGGLHMAASRATSFLASKLPPKPNRLPLDSKTQNSPADLAKFGRYLNAVENPLDVLKSVKSGSVSSEQIETLKTVYPQLYGEMKSQLMEALTSHQAKREPSNIPYQTKMAMSRFLGQPLDSSMLPQQILANQAIFSSKAIQKGLEQISQTGIKPTQKGLSALTKSSRMLMPMQSVAEGREE
jgi:hypothetical protein